MPMVISSSNPLAAQMFAQYYTTGSINNDLKSDHDMCINCPVHRSSYTAKDWAEFVENWEKIECPVLEKNIEGLKLIANGHQLLTSNEPAVHKLLLDCKKWQWIHKAHTQSTERCVNFSTYLAKNNKGQFDASSMFAWTSIAKEPVDDIIREHLKTHVKKGNQQMSKGVNTTDRELKTANSRRNDAKRKKSNTSDYTSRPYPTELRATVQVNHCASVSLSD